MVVARGWENGRERNYLVCIEFQICQMKKFCTSVSKGYTFTISKDTLRIHLILLNCTREIVKIVNSMSCIFYHNKEKGGGVGKITKIE